MVVDGCLGWDEFRIRRGTQWCVQILDLGRFFFFLTEIEQNENQVENHGSEMKKNRDR